MKAVTIVDGDLQWNKHPDPEPGPDELLVAVRAAGLNGADLMQRRGLYPAPPGYPQDIPGMEFAGEVVGLGSEVRPAQRWATGSWPSPAGVPRPSWSWWTRAAPSPCPRHHLGGGRRVPRGVLTAHDALFTQARLAAGERVLVTGAAGGVGTAGVQLAHATGAHVVASVRRAGAA